MARWDVRAVGDVKVKEEVGGWIVGVGVDVGVVDVDVVVSVGGGLVVVVVGSWSASRMAACEGESRVVSSEEKAGGVAGIEGAGGGPSEGDVDEARASQAAFSSSRLCRRVLVA